MTNPQRFVNRMIVFLLLAGGVVGLLYDVIMRAFLHNPYLNGLIVACLLFGIIYSFRRVLVLKPEARWIQEFRNAGPGLAMQSPPRLLTPIAQVLGETARRGRASLATANVRYLLDSVSHRLDENRDVSRYLTGLLIFLGLLGTFWGLLTTIQSVGGVIGDLSLGEGDLVQSFDQLKSGLTAPLSGMGIAFSSSLFGLSGSLILGFLDLQANQAQSSFFEDLEEWLSSLTRLTGGANSNAFDGDGSVPAYIQALLEQTADNLDNLQRLIVRSEQGRADVHAGQRALVEGLSALSDQLAGQRDLLSRMVQSQEDLKPLLGRLGQSGALDDTTRNHIRNMDVQLGRLAEDMTRARAQMTQELRSEIKMVSRTIAHVAGDPHAAAGE
ncbi:flagellar motor protein MotA [Marinivivus vitaminiproducens]|uniref:flagellar motor protein MotA n=1 Tax=Marinivivus vitaminiproducens TaxID=3035935 RepID=UPI0027A5BFC8|nr:flagellar motor protein MotA [Geminicoccaceae bacterium SCSIO 64248]